MSLFLSRLRLGKLRRSNLPFRLILCNGFSSNSTLLQTPPCSILHATYCGEEGLGKPVVSYANERCTTGLEKKIPLELLDSDGPSIGASHGWIATLKANDSIIRLQDDLNPAASDKNPKRIPLPPLVTLPHCQTQIVTNVSMSTTSPEDEECVVAVKFLGPQLSFCRVNSSSSEWINTRIQNPCFFSSPVMFSKKDESFRILGSGGHIIGSWDLHKPKKPKFQRLKFKNIPQLTKTKWELLDSCFTTQHLVESRTTGETFLVKWYRKANTSGTVKMKTKGMMVFKLDDEGNAVYTNDIGDLCIFLSKSKPFCVPASSFLGLPSNEVQAIDVDEDCAVSLTYDSFFSIFTRSHSHRPAFYIPPQDILQ